MAAPRGFRVPATRRATARTLRGVVLRSAAGARRAAATTPQCGQRAVDREPRWLPGRQESLESGHDVADRRLRRPGRNHAAHRPDVVPGCDAGWSRAARFRPRSAAEAWRRAEAGAARAGQLPPGGRLAGSLGGACCAPCPGPGPAGAAPPAGWRPRSHRTSGRPGTKPIGGSPGETSRAPGCPTSARACASVSAITTPAAKLPRASSRTTKNHISMADPALALPIPAALSADRVPIRAAWGNCRDIAGDPGRSLRRRML